MNRIRVALNTWSLVSTHTGIASYTRNLIRALDALGGIDLQLFYGFSWSRTLRDEAVPGVDSLKTAIKRLLPKPYALNRFIQQIAFNKGIAKIKPDLYHEPNFLPFRFDGPTVITVHDLSFIRYPQTHPAARVKIMSELLPSALHRAYQIFTDSTFVKHELMSIYGVAPEKIHAVHLGVSTRYRPMEPQQTLRCNKKYDLIHGQYLLAVGTLEPRKNLLLALRAFRVLPAHLRENYPLVIAGMRGWLTEEVERELRVFEATGQIRWLGYVPGEILPQLYAGACMLLYPSLYEGFGLPPLEAMASGIPVITSDQSSLPEVVGEAGIQIPPDDPDALARVIEQLIENPQERGSRAAAGLERAKIFTWEKCARQTLEVYRLALKS